MKYLPNSFRAAAVSVTDGKPLIAQLEGGKDPQELNSTERAKALT